MPVMSSSAGSTPCDRLERPRRRRAPDDAANMPAAPPKRVGVSQRALRAQSRAAGRRCLGRGSWRAGGRVLTRHHAWRAARGGQRCDRPAPPPRQRRQRRALQRPVERLGLGEQPARRLVAGDQLAGTGAGLHRPARPIAAIDVEQPLEIGNRHGVVAHARHLGTFIFSAPIDSSSLSGMSPRHSSFSATFSVRRARASSDSTASSDMPNTSPTSIWLMPS